MKEKIKNVWAILAQSSAIDRDSNTVSLFDVLEEVTFQVAGTLPEQVVFPINTQLVSLWEREETGEKAELKIRIVLRDPNNKILAQHEGGLRMEPQHKRSRFRAQFQGMPVTIPGRYTYEIVSLEPEKTESNEVVAKVPVEVKITAQPVKSPITL